MQITPNIHRLIWAFHASQDPEKECFFDDDAGSTSILQHTNKGSKSINLDSGIPDEIELENDVFSFEFLMDNVVVPQKDTTYYCKLFKIPYFNNTHHIVKFETIIEEGNEEFVHHLGVFDCPKYIAESDHDYIEGECNDYSINMPSIECQGGIVLYGWTIGGNDIYLPKIGGMSLSGNSNIHYILLQIFYDVKYTFNYLYIQQI